VGGAAAARREAEVEQPGAPVAAQHLLSRGRAPQAVKLKRGKEFGVTGLPNLPRSCPYPIKLAPALVPVSVAGEREGSKGFMIFTVSYGLVCWKGERSSLFLGLSLIFSVF